MLEYQNKLLDKAIKTAQIQEELISLIELLIEEHGYDLDQPIGPESQLVANLGFSSLDFVQLIVDIEAKLGRKLGFQALLLKKGSYVKDVSVGELVQFVRGQLLAEGKRVLLPLGAETRQARASQPGGQDNRHRISEATVSVFQKSIRPRSLSIGTGIAHKNPRAIFVLSPPRSGSTLLRVILAGHPQLFAPPELYLLMYDDLAQRRLELSGEFTNHLLEGTIRALVELYGCDAEVAESMMLRFERQFMPTKEFYALMQEQLGRRFLVDKTPLYPLDPNILAKAELDFDEPLYIHLVRHPYGMIRSYEESRLDRFTPVLYENNFERSQLAELTWVVSHRNIMDFRKQVPDNRWLELHFESLVTRPEQEVARICEFAGISLDPAMLEPYSAPERRMLAGARELTRMPGDLKFHLHKGIEPETATRWQQFLISDFLADLTWDLAESLGYRQQEVQQMLAGDAAAPSAPQAIVRS